MELCIDDLKISNNTKNILRELGFIMVSELKGHDYISLTQKFPFKHLKIYSIIQELNDIGYLLPPEDAISIYDIPMSNRLLHILERNYILYLSQLSLYSKERIARMRNLGDLGMSELEGICRAYHIEVHSIQGIKENLAPYHLSFSLEQYEDLYRRNIISVDDFSTITTQDLHIICKRYFPNTMKLYYILKNKEIVFQSWEDQFLFEVLPKDIARALDRRYGICTISKLRSCSEEFIERMPPTILSSVKSIYKNI